MSEKKNPAIVCCRTVSMLMIVLCHIVSNYTFIPGHGSVSQILNVGVYSFLVISGYLYGGKTIPNFGIWFRKRCVTVILPAFIVVSSVLIAEFCVGEKHNAFSVIVYLLNLQGLGFLLPGFYRYFSEILVLGPLWFITVIMLCYCMVPVLQRGRQKLYKWKHVYAIAVGVTVVCYIVALTTGINAVYFLTFAVGYYLSARNYQFSPRKSESVIFTLLMLGTQILRLVMRTMHDGTPVYQTYTLISHMVLGIWFVWFFLVFNQMLPKLTSRFAERKWMVAANDISFYVYLTHYCFCRGRLDMYQLTDNLFVATIGFTAATLISAIVLKGIVTFIQRNLLARFCAST